MKHHWWKEAQDSHKTHISVHLKNCSTPLQLDLPDLGFFPKTEPDTNFRCKLLFTKFRSLGCFNPSEQYESLGQSSCQIGVNIKMFESSMSTLQKNVSSKNRFEHSGVTLIVGAWLCSRGFVQCYPGTAKWVAFSQPSWSKNHRTSMDFLSSSASSSYTPKLKMDTHSYIAIIFCFFLNFQGVPM